MLWRIQTINIFSKCSGFHGSLYLICSHCWKFTLCQWDGDKDCGEINNYYWIISLCVNIVNVEILPEKKFKFKNRFMNKRYVDMSVCSRTSWPHVSRPVPLHYGRGFEPPSRYTALFLYCPTLPHVDRGQRKANHSYKQLYRTCPERFTVTELQLTSLSWDQSNLFAKYVTSLRPSSLFSVLSDKLHTVPLKCISWRSCGYTRSIIIIIYYFIIISYIMD